MNFLNPDAAKTFATFCNVIKKYWLIVSNRDDPDYEIEFNNENYNYRGKISRLIQM